MYYKSTESINITGILKEDLKENKNPSGTELKYEDTNSYIIWKSDKDIVLKDGTIIKKGEQITTTQLKQIVIKDDLTLTAYSVNDTNIDVPDTASKSSIVILTTGIILISIGCYLVYKRKSEKAQ